MPTEPLYDLLSEALIPVRYRDGVTREHTLPELLSALQESGIESFPTLRPHQTHPWHAFLVQLAAMAIHRARATTEPATPAEWTERLLLLSEGQREPWCLVVPDLSKPAFFQPPVPEGNLAKFNKWPGGTPFPDEIDMLVTAKNHDVKQRRIRRPAPAHWIFALTTMQTSDGFLGRGNYGIVRMNGGFSSRPSIGFTPSLHPDDRFRRDLQVLLATRADAYTLFDYARNGGITLLWLLPWDGAKSVPLTECDPYVIEICRRVRLTMANNAILGHGAPSQGTRIDAPGLNGRTGDPWNAIRRGEPASSLTVGGGGFTYRLVNDLLTASTYAPGAALRIHETDAADLWFTAATLVRGKGKTEGFHERWLPVAGRVRRLLFTREGRELIGKLAEARIQEVSEVQHRALKPAILALLQGAPENLDMKDERAGRWLAHLDDEVDAVFFADLWDSIQKEQDPDEALEDWARTVFELAEKILDEAIDSLPIPDSRKYRAISVAQRIFYGRRKARLGGGKEQTDATAV